jgi:hypothetical protein
MNQKTKKPLLPTRDAQFLKSDELFKQYPLKLKAKAKENIKPIKLYTRKITAQEAVPQPSTLEVKPVEPSPEF